MPYALLHHRCSVALQKGCFRALKGQLSHSKRAGFAAQNLPYQNINLSVASSM